MTRRWHALALGLLGIFLPSALLRGADIPIPNGSFESPGTSFVVVVIDSWQKGAKPAWYDETGGFLWSQLTGIFTNTPPGRNDHLDNCDGQAMWLFAVPEVELFQDYNSVDWDDPAPTHAFDATFKPGHSYVLTTAVLGNGGGMSNGATLRISLYYRDDASNKVTVSATTITNSPDLFPVRTLLTDFQVQVPTVKAGDAWAGRHIGIQILSTVTTNNQGGYWDLDNVRLTETREPALAAMSTTNGQFQFALQSEPGTVFEFLASTNLTLPLSNWTSLGTITNDGGSMPFLDAETNFNRRFYRAQQLP